MKAANMVALDTNILVIADDPSSPHHETAKNLLERVLSGSLGACISQQVLGEYFSVVTSTRRINRPLTGDEAAQRILFLARSRRLKKVYPRHSTLERSVALCARLGIGGARFFDILYAITLLDNNIHRLMTQNVSDFKMVPGLIPENPFR